MSASEDKNFAKVSSAIDEEVSVVVNNINNSPELNLACFTSANFPQNLADNIV